MFSVRAENRHRLLRISLSGFWNEAVMRDYLAVVQAEFRRLRKSGGCRYILIDMTRFAVQPQPIAEAHAANLQAVNAMGGIRVALVMQDGLSKLQARRVAAGAGHPAFDTEGEAIRWLFSADPPPG